MKLFFVKRKTLAVLGCLFLAGIMFYGVNHPAIVGAAATTRQLPIYCVQHDRKLVSVSFDAAWGDERLRQPRPIVRGNAKAAVAFGQSWASARYTARAGGRFYPAVFSSKKVPPPAV